MTGKQLCDMLGGIDESLIYDALEYKPRKKVLLKTLIAAAAVSALIFSTAFALSPSFREFFISVLSPVYDEESYTSIDNGHMTGSFDEDNVIMTFLDSLEKEENISIKSEKGSALASCQITSLFSRSLLYHKSPRQAMTHRLRFD